MGDAKSCSLANGPCGRGRSEISRVELITGERSLAEGSREHRLVPRELKRPGVGWCWLIGGEIRNIFVDKTAG